MMGVTLDRKLLREIRRLKGQVATIALVLAAGITSFVPLRGTHASLIWSRDAYYDRARFAHVFAHVERAPETLSRTLERLPGVARVETRITQNVTVPIEGMARPASGQLLSLPSSGQPAVNALHYRLGRPPMEGRDDEIVILGAFADAHGLQPGHEIPVVINGKLRRMRIVGTAMSPEFIYAIRPGAISDDPGRYGIFWMDRAALAAAFDLEGAFNDVVLRLQPGQSEMAVRDALDRRLARYGSTGAFGRDQQPSHSILKAELGQLGMLAGMVPIIFLGVAAFLINMVLGRLVALQRTEIAALKAVGYRNGEIGRHFLGLVAVVMVPGAVVGLVLGHGLGLLLLDLYAQFFRFPELAFRSSGGVQVTAVVVSAASATLGALLAVRGAVRLPPAEAMRPPSPAKYRRSLLDRLGLSVLLGPTGMMIWREVTRRPLRLAFSTLGIGGAVALIILGRFGMDSMEAYVDGTMLREQRQDLSVTFTQAQHARAVGELAALPGVWKAEGERTIPVRMRNGTQERYVPLVALPPQSTLRQIVTRAGPVMPLPPSGILASDKLAEVLNLRVGDRTHLEVREGDRRTTSPVLTGLVPDSVGLQLYARQDVAAQLMGDAGAVSAVRLRIDPQQRREILDRLRQMPFVLDVSDLRADVDRMRKMNESAFAVWTFVAVSLGAAVILGVVYNNARIALASRSRELATLRVMGFSRKEIATVLLGSLALEVLLAIPVGLVLGRAWGELFVSGMDAEMFRWSVTILPGTYLAAAFVALLAAMASAAWVRRSLDRLDLIGVLKTRE